MHPSVNLMKCELFLGWFIDRLEKETLNLKGLMTAQVMPYLDQVMPYLSDERGVGEGRPDVVRPVEVSVPRDLVLRVEMTSLGAAVVSGAARTRQIIVRG